MHDLNDDASQQERQIMALAQRDPAAFRPLYERYFARVYAYCLRRVTDRQEAEDLTSSIFTKALSHLDGYRGGQVAAWLFRIAHNEVANHWRGQREQVSLDAYELDLEAETLPPADWLIAQENAEALQRAVALLPAAQQELLALKLAGQLTSEQIGDVLGKSSSAVRVELHRIMKQLRLWFEQEYDA
jgi:RNA polymerase sigma-70 factor (ECF subfamily)